MRVFLGFLLFVFVIAAVAERRGGQLRVRTLLVLTTIVGLSFYSLRVMS